jgi:hypothetical protein
MILIPICIGIRRQRQIRPHWEKGIRGGLLRGFDLLALGAYKNTETFRKEDALQPCVANRGP